MVETMISASRWPSLLLLGVWLGLPARSAAHQLDEYLQATLVKIEPGAVRLLVNLTPGVEVAGPLLTEIDRDGDGVISPTEAATYAETVRGDLVLRLDEREMRLKAVVRDFPSPGELRSGWGIIQLEFTADFAALSNGAHRLLFQNRHRHNTSVYLVNAALPPEDLYKVTAQKRTFRQSTGEIKFTWQAEGRR